MSTRCRGIPLPDGHFTGCAYGDGEAPPFTGPCDCPTCRGLGLEDRGSLEVELQRMYDSEISLSIAWLWDGGIHLDLGAVDNETGHDAETIVRTAAEILPWLQRTIMRLYPESDYAKSLRK